MCWTPSFMEGLLCLQWKSDSCFCLSESRSKGWQSGWRCSNSQLMSALWSAFKVNLVEWRQRLFECWGDTSQKASRQEMLTIRGHIKFAWVSKKSAPLRQNSHLLLLLGAIIQISVFNWDPQFSNHYFITHLINPIGENQISMDYKVTFMKSG